MFLEGKTVTVWRFSETGEKDEMGEALKEWTPETVENVLYAPTSSNGVQDGERPLGTSDTITVHFPKSYTAPLSGCKIGAYGKKWSVIGDPQGYPDELCPGAWNRTAIAKKVDG